MEISTLANDTLDRVFGEPELKNPRNIVRAVFVFGHQPTKKEEDNNNNNNKMEVIIEMVFFDDIYNTIDRKGNYLDRLSIGQRIPILERMHANVTRKLI